MSTAGGDPAGGRPQQPTEEELRAAYEAELKKIRVEQVLLEHVVTLINLGMRRTGLAPGTESERDQTQVRLAIEAVRAMLPLIEQIRSVADALSKRDCDLGPVRTLLDRLEDELLPHERADEAELIPLVDRALRGSDATAAMSRTHAEIEHQVGKLRRLLEGLDSETTQAEDVVELRRLLYGLYAVLRLHNAQEEEGAFSLVPNGAGRGGPAALTADAGSPRR